MGSKKLVAKGPRLIRLWTLALTATKSHRHPELQSRNPRIHLRRFGLEPLAKSRQMRAIRFGSKRKTEIRNARLTIALCVNSTTAV